MLKNSSHFSQSKKLYGNKFDLILSLIRLNIFTQRVKASLFLYIIKPTFVNVG